VKRLVEARNEALVSQTQEEMLEQITRSIGTLANVNNHKAAM
jgi:hypothetical protein